MLFDANLLFWHATTAYQFTSGEFVSLIGVTGSCTSTVINLGNARDLGIGDGPDLPNIAIAIGTGITNTSSPSMTLTAAFQGSTDSSTWTTYMQSPAYLTGSLTAGSFIMPARVPRRPDGAALPLYYRVVLSVGANGASLSSISTGSVLGGIVLERGDLTFGAYPAGFSFPSAA